MFAQTKNRQSGFTLVEIVITVFIIGVMLMLYQVAGNATRHNQTSGYKEMALRIAHKEIQNIRTTPFATIPTSGAIINPSLDSLPQSSAYLTRTDIEEGLVSIQVEVFWINPGETAQQNLSLTTYISQGGLGQQ